MSQKQHTVWLLKKQLHMEQIRTNDVKNISYYSILYRENNDKNYVKARR